MRLYRRTLALLAAVTALVAGSVALADRARVILIGPSLTHPTVVRARDELQVLGIEVEVMTLGAGTSSDLAAIARKHKAAAVARVEDRPPEIIVWVDPARQPDQPLKSAEIRVSESLSGPVEPGLLALRAVELLRGKLIPVDAGRSSEEGGKAKTTADASSLPAPPTTSTSPHRPGVSPPAPARAGARVSGFLGGAVLLSPGGVPITPQIRLGARFSLHARVGVEGLAFFPAAPATLSMPEGMIELHALGFGAGPFARLTGPASDLSATVAAGLGAMLLLFEGSARPPFVAIKGSGWTALPYVGAALSYEIHPLFGLRADVIAAIALPEPVIRAAMREVASMGRPALLFSIGIEVRP